MYAGGGLKGGKEDKGEREREREREREKEIVTQLLCSISAYINELS